MMPITTWTVIAVVPWNPSAHGDTIAQSPATRFSHSSHTANAARAAMERIAMTMPVTQASWDSCPAANPNIHGDENRIAPRIRFARSQYFSFDHTFMTSSFLRTMPTSTPPVPDIETRKFAFRYFSDATRSERPVPARPLRCWLGGLAFGRLGCAIG